MVILEEGNLSHPRCPLYDIQVLWAALNGRHNTNAQYNNGVEQKRHRLAAEEMRSITERAFQAFRIPLNLVTPFKHLERIMTASYDDWPEVVRNLRKAKKSLAWLSRILGREGDNPMVLGVFFKVMVQEVLILGLDMWVMTPLIGQALRGGGVNTG